MDELTYIEAISANLIVSICCVCDLVVDYKDAQRELQIGDQVLSHTYCKSCLQAIRDREDHIRERFQK